MRIQGLLLTIVCSMSLIPAAAQQKAGKPCDPEQIHSLQAKPAGDEFSDLKFLKPLLKDKQVVLLGESSHGVGDYYAFKSRMIRFLHQECGFEVLAMESGIADIYLEYQKVDTIAARRLRNNTVFGNFQCAEILPLYEYIKETARSNHPLYYAGFDSQNFSASFNLTRKMLQQTSGAAGDSLMRCMEAYYRIPSLLWQEDRMPLFRLADTISRAAAVAQQLLELHKAQLQRQFTLSDTAFLYLQRGLRNMKESVQLDWANANPSSHRDSLMADNLFWLMQQQYPGKKVIVWAHNGHIDRKASDGNPYKWLGHYVSARFGKASYHIGLFSQRGQTYEWWTKTNRELNNTAADDLEQLADYYPITYIHFNGLNKSCDWAWKTVYGFELENGGRLSFVPAQRFDAVIIFRNVGLPEYKQ